MRALRHVACLPLSLVGLVLAVLYVPRWVRWRDGVLEVGVSWLVGFRSWPWSSPAPGERATAGQTICPHIICYRDPDPDQVPRRRRLHELEHTEQMLRWWGLPFWFVYLGWGLVLAVRHRSLELGYRAIPFEVAARVAERG